ncbi:N-acetylglucosamine-6-phosphate deacetylase [Actinomadura montaniterrae]|uniref:N-acetylglucosamine-6-phosphate deacetylase n=1 Tax=Actinomadura montaniterrae TaxID=1803903 RepID=A0A6L3VRL6_9ACTN|nr:N-acetylglucosamine-6-phosphate deacetylase [Actinomadura montaniterrae]KAB2369650.1 N-acetylglucosamine-6-phosphate deacetylase [Actinomadura montaniterrae]
MMNLTNARIVLPGGVTTGTLHVDGGRLAAPSADSGLGETVDLGGRHVVPGFVDMHVHGGAGASYQTGRPEEAEKAARFHLGHGTTTTVASLVTGTPDELANAVASLADLAADGLIAGVHLEGPYLARDRCGAHDPGLLRHPDRAEFAHLARLGRGHLRMITLAPELPGALGLVRDAASAGVIAAVGHTDAPGETARTAFDAGATVATHLFNAMRPLHHREGGPVAAALNDPRVTAELINDGVHVEAAVARLALAAAPGRVALITDAMAAAGMGDGDYRLGVMDVQVRDGRATLAGGTSIAGSTITMADAFRRAVAVLGLPIEAAAVAASLVPARALGLDSRVGSLEPGKDADLVVLNDDMSVHRVMKAGHWV